MKIEQFQEAIKDLSSVMMSTSDDGSLEGTRTRPMSVAKVADEGTLYFLTSVDTSQVSAVKKNDVGMCTGQSKTQFVTMSGTFELSKDRALIEELWSKMAEAWFPKGKDDPNIRVMIFRAKKAELWDLSGPKGLSYFIDVAKSWITKEPPKASPETHGKVDLTH